jgi:hypothetical protein
MGQQAVLRLITAPALSSPNALSSVVPALRFNDSDGNATLAWNGVGATQVTNVSVAASISTVATGGEPSGWTGFIDILCASTGNADTCLRYTAGAETAFASSYTGLLIDHNYKVGPPVWVQCPVTGSIPFGLWTRVEVRLGNPNGETSEVLINGISAGFCNGTYNQDTVGSAIVGLRAYPDTEIPMTYYYDNVIVAVRR